MKKLVSPYTVLLFLVMVLGPRTLAAQESATSDKPTVGGIITDVVNLAFPQVGGLIAGLFDGDDVKEEKKAGGEDKTEKEVVEDHLDQEREALERQVHARLTEINTIVKQLDVLGRIAKPTELANIALAEITQTLTLLPTPNDAQWADIQAKFFDVEEGADDLAAVEQASIDEVFLGDDFIYERLSNISDIDGSELERAKLRLEMKNADQLKVSLVALQEDLKGIPASTGLYIARLERDLKTMLDSFGLNEEEGAGFLSSSRETELRIQSFERMLEETTSSQSSNQ